MSPKKYATDEERSRATAERMKKFWEEKRNEKIKEEPQDQPNGKMEEGAEQDSLSISPGKRKWRVSRIVQSQDTSDAPEDDTKSPPVKRTRRSTLVSLDHTDRVEQEDIEKERAELAASPGNIPKPKGVAGARPPMGYNLREEMGLAGDNPRYNRLRAFARNVASHYLDMTKTVSRQDPTAIKNAYQAMCDKHPLFTRFIDNWASRDMFTKILLYSSRNQKSDIKDFIIDDPPTTEAVTTTTDHETEAEPAEDASTGFDLVSIDDVSQQLHNSEEPSERAAPSSNPRESAIIHWPPVSASTSVKQDMKEEPLSILVPRQKGDHIEVVIKFNGVERYNMEFST